MNNKSKSKYILITIIVINLLLIPFLVIADDNKYDPKDLSDYFGTMKACDYEGGDNDCRNGNEYKFYLKMYDIYFLYQKKYNVKLDLPLIMAALYYNDDQLPTVFKNNLNNYDRNAVKSGNGVTNLDWEYDYKNDPCYTYLNANDFSYDMQILAKNMVKKSITYKCSEGGTGEAEDIETSNYSKETLKCEKGEYDKDSISATYKIDMEKYDEFLLEYVKLKYHTPGTEVKECGTNISGNNGSSYTVVTKTGQEAIDKMNEIALKQVGNGGSKYQDWFGLHSDWCGMFVSWLFDQVGGLDKYIVKNGVAGEIPGQADAKGYGTWYEDECTDSSTVPKAGDLILYDPWVGNYTIPYPENGGDKYFSSHIGYVYQVDDQYVYSVEGNGYDGNGNNVVMDHKHSRKDCGSGTNQGINGYFRPKY